MIDSEAERRRVVCACLNVTKGTAIAADFYERRLLVQYVKGALTIEQVCSLLDRRPLPTIVFV
ncbi:hypothetical protein [Hymenobacter sp. PAMC 26628]|uniref:hypothetical protein n=1 Tax=Hymenobacter sp. PAMC 26628 TaxID=1484118 RepID=UPI0012FF664F|nr:hypothetical protein [Hymenobacter sp. PAMC 26628]